MCCFYTDSTSIVGSGSGLESGSGSGFELSILFPFGVSEGDQLVPLALNGTTAPQSKLALSGITCPFFGVNESTLHVIILCKHWWHVERKIWRGVGRFREIKGEGEGEGGGLREGVGREREGKEWGGGGRRKEKGE